jgi:hypothetical protein
MHNLDRTQVGFSQGFGEFEFSEGESVFNESEQAELAAELLEVSNEAELDQFLGDLISKAGHAIGSFVGSPTGQALGSALKGVAKQVLPMAGQALGGYLGGSGGAQIGGQLATAASGLFEAESGEQEWEAANTFVRLAADAAKSAAEAPASANPRAVAQAAVKQAAQTHAPNLLTVPDAAAASKQGQGGAGTSAANGHSHGAGGHTGRWIRRGNRIILIGA